MSMRSYGLSVRYATLAFVLFLAACSHKPAPKTYDLQGRVVAVDPATHELTIAHQDVPGLMKGMTMPFLVSDSDVWIFGAIAPGDDLHATLVLSDHAELRQISFTKANPAGVSTTSNLRIPQPGDVVPDFSFVNQDGKTIHFSQFHGRPLLLTFIYTSCLFPDYCPRMSSNFRQVLEALHSSPAAFKNAQLLSISIDPQNDKPAILRSYGKRYTSDVDPRFAHWQFVSGSPADIRQAADFFGLAYNTENGQIVHSLRTVLIDSRGRIAKVYSGNDWKAADVASDFTAASAP